jgi:hypothetical protein
MRPRQDRQSRAHTASRPAGSLGRWLDDQRRFDAGSPAASSHGDHVGRWSRAGWADSSSYRPRPLILIRRPAGPGTAAVPRWAWRGDLIRAWDFVPSPRAVRRYRTPVFGHTRSTGWPSFHRDGAERHHRHVRRSEQHAACPPASLLPHWSLFTTRLPLPLSMCCVPVLAAIHSRVLARGWSAAADMADDVRPPSA